MEDNDNNGSDSEEEMILPLWPAEDPPEILCGVWLHQIIYNRAMGNQSFEEGNIEEAIHFLDAAIELAIALHFNNEGLLLQICNERDYYHIIHAKNLGQEKFQMGDIKGAENMFNSALTIAAVVELQGRLHIPELRQELKREHEHCQAMSLKEDGKKAFQEKNYPRAIENYTKALQKTETEQNNDLILQLLISRCIANTKIGKLTEALDDAQRCIELAPSSCYLGYLKKGQLLKTLNRTKDALDAMRDGLSATDPPLGFIKSDFVYEMLTLTSQLLENGNDFTTKSDTCEQHGQYKCVLTGCKIDFETWSYVFKKLAVQGKWILMKHLVLEEALDNMDACGKQVQVGDLIEYCKNEGGRDAKLWGQKLAIELMERGSPYPTKTSIALMKRSMDLGIITGDFCLLEYIFKEHVTSVADRNQVDTDGKGLSLYLARSYGTRQENAMIALHLLGSHGIDVCTQNDMTDVEYCAAAHHAHGMQEEENKGAEGGLTLVDMHSSDTETAEPFQNKEALTSHASGESSYLQDTHKVLATPDSKGNGGARPKEKLSSMCKKCSRKDTKAYKSYKSNRTVKACSLWIGIITEEGHILKEHSRWRKKAQSGILDILKRRGVQDSLKLLKAEEYSYFVKEAGHDRAWWLVKELITAYEKNNGEDGIKDLAKDVDITGYFDRPGHERDYTTLEAILRAGASATEGPTYQRQPLKEAMTYKDWKAIPLLVDYGADVGDFSLTDGDTPLHAALQVAMTEDKNDNFDVLQRLLDLHHSEPTRYQCLNPSRQDNFGDTLFHMAAKVKDHEIGLKAVEFLSEKGVNPNALNNDRKTALQCLEKKTDRRAHGIRVAGDEFLQHPTDETTMTMSKKSNVKDFSRQVSSDSSKEMPLSDCSGSKVQGNKPVSVGKVKRRAARLIREDIQKFLNTINQKESDYSDNDFDDEEDDGDTTTKPAQEASSGQLYSTNSVSKDNAIGNNDINETRNVTSNSTLSLIKVERQETNMDNVRDRTYVVDANKKGNHDLEVHVLSAVGNINHKETTGNSGIKLNDSVAESKGRDNKTLDRKDEDSNNINLEGNDDDVTIDPISFKELEWEIVCTSEVWNVLFKKTFDNKMKNRIFKTIKMLGSGEFENQPHLMKRLHSVPSQIKLYEAKITKAARIIWEIDIAFSSRQSDPSTIRLTENQEDVQSTGGKPIYAEVIRLWDIVFNHDHINRSVQNVVRSHNKGEDCLLQKKLEGIKGKDDCYREDGKRIPRTFSEVDGGLQLVKFFPPASAKETEYHIMKWYSFDYLVSSILQNQSEKIDFPFSVTEREYAVINIEQKPPCALLLLGRSGTGKTTCCLYRLWSKFVTYWKLTEADNPLIPRAVMHTRGEMGDENLDVEGDDQGSHARNTRPTKSCAESINPSRDDATCDHLHQVFITKNPVLCTEISKNFKYLSHGCPEAKPRVDVEDKPLPNRLQLAHPCAYPLFVTSKQFLILLDASLPGPHYFLRNEDGSLKQDIAGWGEEDGPLTFIPDMDAEDDLLPVDEYDNRIEPVADEDRDKNSKREVTYEVFANELWPEIIKHHKVVTCHPTLVWTEINSFIKGSIEALCSEGGKLDLENYNELGKKRAPNFPGCRELVYQLFETYSKLIKRKRWFDEMDLIFNLYNRMKNVPVPEWYIHEIYVDETQDFTQAELALLIRCCQDPNNMFLTGDTAQSIMRGIAFRFEDLKSLYHYARESQQAIRNTKSIEVPKTVYQLIHNYRSHAGILNLATSILDLVDCFFPSSYDRKGLEKDRGLFEGPKPVLIACCNYSDLAIVLCGNKRETSQIEFGAHQAILVVNDEARDNLPEELGFGLVLTIYESKGLEFDDILIYNFFKDSQAKEEWRVVLKHLDKIIEQQEEESSEGMNKTIIEIDTEASTDKYRPRSLDFDPEKHKILNSELKHLYTAVTRARVNIWFFDEDEEARAPMFTYFQARKLVKTVEAKGEEDEQRLTELFSKKSSKREWKLKGDDLLRKNLYKVAAECYKKAGRTRHYHQCLANQQALAAKRTDDKHLKRERYLAVSLEYLKCHEYLQAAKCLVNAKEYNMAAALFANDKVKKYIDAAILYKLLKLKDKACEMYDLGNVYREAIHLFYDMEKYDKAINVLGRYQKTSKEYQRRNEPFSQKIVKYQPCQAEEACHMCNPRKLGQKAAAQQLKAGNHARLMEYLEFFHHDDAIMFLTKNGLREMAAEFHRKHGKNIEAAEVYKRLGNIDRAIECVDADGGESGDQILCGQLKLEKARSLLKHTASKEASMEAIELLKSAQAIFGKHKDPMNEAECLLLQGIHSDISNTDREQILFKAYRKCGNWSIGEIECIYQVVKLLPNRITMRECENIIIRCIGTALQLVLWLKHPAGGPTVKAAEAVKKCLKFHGLETIGLHDKSLLEIRQPEARIKTLCMSEGFALLDDGKISKEEAKNLIVKDLLRVKMKLIWTHARAIATKAKAAAMMCPQYRLGFTCAKWMKDGACSLRHMPYDLNSFGTLIESSTLIMQLDSAIAKTKQEPQLQQGEVALLEEYTSNTIDSFGDLCDIIFPLDRQEPVLFGSLKVTWSFLECFRKTTVKDQMMWNTMWKMDQIIANDPVAKYTAADLHFFLHLTYLLVGETRKVQQVLLETEKDPNPPVAIYTAFEVLQVDRETTVRHHIFHYIVNMLSMLYDDRNPRDTIGYCDKYFHEVGKRGHTKMFPSFAHTMMMFEYQLALSCCMYLKNIGGTIQAHSFLPKSYLAHIAFFDCAYGGEKQLPTFSIIQNYKAEDRYMGRLLGGLWNFAKLFCGQRFPRFHMLKDVFTEGSPYIETGEAERVFVFALVLLVNINKAVPNTWRNDKYCMKSLELMLMTNIAAINLDDTTCPRRLRDAVEATKKASGLREIVCILIKLLEARAKEELMDCTWAKSSKKRRNFCSDKFRKHVLVNDSFFKFRSDAPEAKSTKKPAHTQFFESQEVEPGEEGDEEGSEENDGADYAKKVLLQQEAHQLDIEQDMSATGISAKLEEATEVDLKIDDTMCNTCGVTFSETSDEQSGLTESKDAIEDISQSEKLTQVGINRQISTDSGPSSIHFSRSFSQAPVQTRHEHESSEAHTKKQAQCRTFLKFIKEGVRPLLQKASSLVQQVEGTGSANENMVRIKDLARKLDVFIGTQREKREWSNIKPAILLCQTIKEVMKSWLEGPSVLEEEKPSKDPLLNASSGREEDESGVSDAQLDAEEEVTQIPDELNVIDEPANRKKDNYRKMPAYRHRPRPDVYYNRHRGPQYYYY